MQQLFLAIHQEKEHPKERKIKQKVVNDKWQQRYSNLQTLSS